MTLPAGAHYSWSLLDRVSGATIGSANASQTSFTESMVKVWLAADHLARAEARRQEPSGSRLRQLSTMIRDSDDGAAQTVWRLNGGDSVIRRMIKTCSLTDTEVHPGWWSKTMMSARDAVRLGSCVADGSILGPEWTEWLLAEMRQVRGEGDFGIGEAVPPRVDARLAVKNGWTLHGFDGQWRVNCLAIHDDWVLAVMTRYPARLGLDHGADVCSGVARQALVWIL